MSTIHDLINVGYCTQNGINGTSNDFCILDMDRVKKLLRYPYGYKFADNFEPTEANFKALIQEGTMTVIYDVVEGGLTTGENETQTFTGGDMKVSNKLPIMLEGKMLNGTQGYLNTISVSNANGHSFILVDVNDTLFGYKGKDGQFRPINSKFFSVEPYTKSGTDASQYGIKLQLDRNQFDTGLSGLVSESYDFDIDDVKGYQNLEITIPTAPSVGDTQLIFKVVRKEDREPQLGLTNTEVKIYVDGVAVATPSLGTATSEGVYTATGLTALTLGQKVEVKTNDGTYNIVDNGVALVKSNTAQTVVL